MNGNNTVCTLQNVPVGFWVSQVRATDKDEGKNGQVRFEFVENEINERKDWLKFTIHSSDGNITTKEHIDREEQEIYFVSVLVLSTNSPFSTDKDTNFLSTQTRSPLLLYKTQIVTIPRYIVASRISCNIGKTYKCLKETEWTSP